jgi:hypothetical protein
MRKSGRISLAHISSIAQFAGADEGIELMPAEGKTVAVRSGEHVRIRQEIFENPGRHPAEGTSIGNAKGKA